MDAQQLLQRTLDVKQQFKEQCKCVIITFYIVTLLIAVSAILCIVSSSNISSIYYDGVQLTIIVSGAIIFPFLLGSIYSLYKLNNTSAKLIVFSLMAYLFQSIMLSVVFVSLILTILQTFCGYFITHEGYYDGAYITTSIETGYQYPTCYQLNNGGGSKKAAIYQYAQQVLISSCGGEKYTSCTLMETLEVTNWGDKFSSQLAGCIIGGISNVVYIIIIIMVRIRLKRIRDTAQQNAVIIQAQHIAANVNANNMPNVQYVVIQDQSHQNIPQNYQQPIVQGNFQPYMQPQYPNYPHPAPAPAGGIQNPNYYPPNQQNYQQQQQYGQNQYI